jgi:two-component system phosphate regulon sensor histidine kinase PhoR
MKHRIRSIFWLLALCILGINGFQAYWLYNTYQLADEQFTRTVNEALLAVALRQQFGSAGSAKFRMVPYGDSAIGRDASRSQLAKRHELLPPSPGDTAKAATVKRLFTRSQQRVSAANARCPGRHSLRAIPDSIAKIDLPLLTAAYQTELRHRDTEADFVLDTVNLRQPTNGYGPRVDAPPGYVLHTRQVPISIVPWDNWRLQASFRRPTFHILRRMGGLLGGSVALLALTTGCFMLMLNTILRQKKLADIKNDFINNMTHELKTPLATVLAAVEALQHFGALNDPQKTQAYLNISRHELQRLSDLVEKVLNIAVEEQQALHICPEPAHPAQLVQDLVARYQLKASKPVHFQIDIDPHDVVALDPLHFGNAINNLIDNAIKYSGEEVNIALRGQRDGSSWHLIVQDDGIGIPNSYQEAIFDRFFRVPTGNLHNVKGFGLGLYYVRQVVARHGGRIEVRSGGGRGSEFVLWVPVTA